MDLLRWRLEMTETVAKSCPAGATSETMVVVPDGLWPSIEVENPKRRSSLKYLLGIPQTLVV